MTDNQIELLAKFEAMPDSAYRRKAVEWLTDSIYREEITSQWHSTHGQGAGIDDMDGVQTAAMYSALYGADVHGDVEAAHGAYNPETPTAAMVSQGGNASWLQAIRTAEANATPEGQAKTAHIRGERRRYLKRNIARTERSRNDDMRDGTTATERKAATVTRKAKRTTPAERRKAKRLEAAKKLLSLKRA